MRVWILSVFMVLIGCLFLSNIVYATACTNNWLSGNCIGSVTYTGSVTLTGNVFVSSGINTGTAYITTNGFYLADGGVLSGSGTIAGGNIIGTNGISGYNYPINSDGLPGTSFPSSYGGSGSSGGGGGSSLQTGGGGGNTLTPGGAGGNTGGGNNGGTPSAPTLNNANIYTWSQSIITYMSSGGGGGAGASGNPCSTAGVCPATGQAVYGVYVQTESGTYTGNLYCNGQNGQSDGGGASGGSFCLVASNTAISGLTCSDTGGSGGANVHGQQFGAGNGGAGQCDTYLFTTPPIPPPQTTLPGIPFISIVTNPLTFGYTDLVTAYSTNILTDNVLLEINTINGNWIIYNPATNSFNYELYDNITPLAIGNYLLTVNDVIDGLTNTILLSVLPINTTPSITNTLLIIPGSNILDDPLDTSLIFGILAIVFGYMYTQEKFLGFKFLWLVVCLCCCIGAGVFYQITTSITASSSTSGGITNTTITPVYGTSNYLNSLSIVMGMLLLVVIVWFAYHTFLKDTLAPILGWKG